MNPKIVLRPGVLVGALAAGGLWLAAPEIYTGTFSDLGTFLTVLALAVGVGLWVVAVKRFVEHRTLRLAMTAVPLGILAFVLLWPYLRPPTEVNEAFPTVVVTDPTTTTAPTTTEPPTTTALPNTTAPSTTMPSTTMPTTTAPPSTTTAPPTTTVAAAPVELARAGFQGLTGHRGSGDAALYQLENDSILLRFEEVDIGSGPDLNVWLVPGDDQRSLDGGTFIAPLTAERGNQNYEVPAGLDLTSGPWTVLVWCDTFSVEVANATLA